MIQENIYWDELDFEDFEKKLKENDLNSKKLKSIIKRLRKIDKELEDTGLYIFGGAGNGTLRCNHPWEIVADIGIHYDGGDGGSEYWE